MTCGTRINGNERVGRTCPHCDARSKIRSSYTARDGSFETMRACLDPLCGHVWVDQYHAARTLVPSMKPRVGICIPLSPRARAGIQAAMQQLHEEQSQIHDIFGDRS